MYRLRRIPRSVSLFLSFSDDREKSILHLYIACLSLSLPPFSAKTLLAYIRTLPRGSARAETRKPVFAMREPALAKNKSASDSLSFAASFASRNFLSPRTLPWKKSSGGHRERCTRARSTIYRTFDHNLSNRALSSINNHVHHLSSLFVDRSRWRARKITS